MIVFTGRLWEECTWKDEQTVDRVSDVDYLISQSGAEFEFTLTSRARRGRRPAQILPHHCHHRRRHHFTQASRTGAT